MIGAMFKNFRTSTKLLVDIPREHVTDRSIAQSQH
jgi:hypothetical protein